MTDPLALLDELDKAHAALPSGSWEVTDDVHRHGVHEYGIWTNEGEYGRYVVEVIPSQADAAAIVAAVNAVPHLTAALRAALVEHQPLMNTNPRRPACPDCLGGIYAADPDEPRPCGCWGLSTPVCSSCADHHAIRPFVLQWPCPTVAAITAALAGADR